VYNVPNMQSDIWHDGVPCCPSCLKPTHDGQWSTPCECARRMTEEWLS